MKNNININKSKRLKILLENAISLITESFNDRYNTDGELFEVLYNELGTTEKELKALGISIDY